MLSERMVSLGTKRSVIRELFEYGKQRAAVIGKENVFDFSLGNPSVEPPLIVSETIQNLVEMESPVALHGYTSAPGDFGVRKTIADSIQDNFGIAAKPADIYMTCGAAASLCICFSALVSPGEEVLAFAPFFPEYRVFVEQVGGNLISVPCSTEDFQPNIASFEAAVNDKTTAVIINSPNNPTGVVWSRDTIRALCQVMEKAEKRFGHPIYLIADEPYRELVYDDIEVPYIPNFYKNTIVCYSFSKSLSLPGERIGYIYVPEQVEQSSKVMAAVQGAGRSLGYVCAPSLFQRVIAVCIGNTADLTVYRRNRDLLYQALKSYGFSVVHPDGAFYLFVRSPEASASAFSERAKQHELLLVPSDDFGMDGYVRIAYCVDTETVHRSLPAFRRLAQEYNLTADQVNL